MNRRVLKALTSAFLILVTMVTGWAAPASAATLGAVSWSVDDNSFGASNTSYTWNFTTSTSSNLSKATAAMPTGTRAANPRLRLPGIPSDRAYTPDRPANTITGDLDVRALVALDNWASGDWQTIVSQWDTGKRSYTLSVSSSGHLELYTSSDGSSPRDFVSDAALGLSSGQQMWLRATLDVDDGLGGHVARFYTSNDGSSWTAFGSAKSGAGTAPIFNSDAEITIGSTKQGTVEPVAGDVFAATVQDGISGTTVVDFDPTLVNDGSNVWTGRLGESWTVNQSSANGADVVSNLSVIGVSGLPGGGASEYRYRSRLAVYSFASTMVSSGANVSVHLGGVTNTKTAAFYTSLVTTYNGVSSVDSGTTNSIMVGGAQSNSTITVAVEPSLTFSVSGRASVCNSQSAANFQTATSTAVSLGRLNAVTTGGGAQDLAMSTNAANGFVVYARTSGITPNALRDPLNHSIADVSGTNSSPGSPPTAGTAAFGYTSSDPSTSFTPNTWAKLTNTNSSVMIGLSGTFSKSSCIGFQAAVSSTTPAGSYSTDVVYTAVPSF